jgi:hypothetical protein
MKDLQDLLTKTMNDDGIDSGIPQDKPSLTIIIGGYNSIQSRSTSFQINTDKLPETIESIAQGLKDVPPEAVEKIAEPLSRLIDAIAEVIIKNRA